MDSGTLMHLVSAAMMVALKISGPILATALVIGLLISLFQALTQINEATLAFLPKLVVMIMVFWFTLPWIIREIVSFTTEMFHLAAKTGA
jgi:flagellar biosynthetic protein FliQ